MRMVPGADCIGSMRKGDGGKDKQTWEKNGKKPHRGEKAARKTMKSNNLKKLKEAGGKKILQPKQRDRYNMAAGRRRFREKGKRRANSQGSGGKC